jgi:hypothetical protein
MEARCIGEALRSKHRKLVKLWLTCPTFKEAGHRFLDLLKFYGENFRGEVLEEIVAWLVFWHFR